MTTHFVIMGVCGCGKTTTAQALQQRFQCPYAEGDDFHSQAARDKMGAGHPLNDEDRQPWLERLRDWMSAQAAEGKSHSVVTCSALKRKYRDTLRQAQGNVVFIHLAPPEEINLERMKARKGHYMKADMLHSQLSILEELNADESGIRIGSAGAPDEVNAEVIQQIKQHGWD